MRRFTTIFVFLFTITLAAQGPKGPQNRFEGLSAKQQATLMMKQMTLALDLNKAQQKKVLSLLEDQVNFREEVKKTRAAHHAGDEKPSAKERFEFQEKQLDHQIAFKNNMKEILDATQYEKFEKMNERRKMRMQERGQRGQNREGNQGRQKGPKGPKGQKPQKGDW